MTSRSSIQMPRVLSQRGKSQYEIERENFEKHQTQSIHKAVNYTECPVKEKHVRTLLIGTHQEKSAQLFWNIVVKLPLQDHPVISWKFCCVVHKLLREGHTQVILDTQRYERYITDLGKLWGHLKEGYGRLIAFYCKLIIQKLTFHQKYPSIVGTLHLSEEELERICANDINSYFELCVDMLDYLDDILLLQAQVFGSLDMSRSNSMTAMGQCRLSPLIMCIQDSCQLYDYIVKILFHLHSSLPPDTLSGHRDRFYAQYKSLKQFYYNSTNLQYFKTLIRVPTLPEHPPNFLVASDLSSHVAPVAVIPEPEPEPAGTITPDTESVQDLLIDTDPNDPWGDPFGQNGMPSPPQPDDRDRLIEQLMQEVNQLKEELARVKAEDAAMVESLQNRIRELEAELNEMKQIAESTQQENESLRTILKETEQHASVADQMASVEKMAKANEEKFKKMKNIYSQLREEHVKLLRTNAENKKLADVEKREKSEMEKNQQDLQHKVHVLSMDKSRMEASLQQSSSASEGELAMASARTAALEQERDDLQAELDQHAQNRSGLEQDLDNVQKTVSSLQEQLDKAAQDRAAGEEALREQQKLAARTLLECAITEGKAIIQDSLDEFDDPHHHNVSCTAEYLLHRTEPALSSLDKLQAAHVQYSTDQNAISSVIESICDFSHRLSDIILQGKATSNSAPIEQGDELSLTCRNTGLESMKVLDALKESSLGDNPESLRSLLQQMRSQAETLVPKIEDVKAEKMGDLIDQEMQETTDAIEQAAKRIADMLAQSRQADSGIKLEVNERILDSCNGLMMTIRVLVEKSKSLQREIVHQGRGTSNAKEFYKKHHRWTEGLISAAKAVGWGANALVEAADKAVKGDGKFELLMVCSQEIAASTTQLVVASKVKADRQSTNLAGLSEASKGVSQATGKVVASAKSASQMVDDMDTMDFSKLTLHQAKRLEMDSQVRVLELESGLEKERVKLAELRKKHYALAGESEGWEVETESGGGQ